MLLGCIFRCLLSCKFIWLYRKIRTIAKSVKNKNGVNDFKSNFFVFVLNILKPD